MKTEAKVIQMNGRIEVPGVVFIDTPSVPNFVIVNGNSTSVAELTDDQVNAICQGWANKFKNHVASKKAQLPSPPTIKDKE